MPSMSRCYPLREHTSVFFVGILFGLLPITTVRADLTPNGPPPEVVACASRKSGEVCDFYGRPGTCVGKPCNLLDYSKGSPPEVIESECIECAEVAADQQHAISSAPGPSTPAVAPPLAASTTGRCSIDPKEASVVVLLLAALSRRGRRRWTGVQSPAVPGSDAPSN